MNKDRLLEVSVVANRLNVSVQTVYRLIKAKKLLARRMGVSQCVRVFESSVGEFATRRSEMGGDGVDSEAVGQQ